MNAAALAMEQALTPAEIFPVAVRVLSTLDLDSAVFLTDDAAPRRLVPHCWGSGASGEVRARQSTDPDGPAVGMDEVGAVAEAMDRRRAVLTTLSPEALGRLNGVGTQQLWPGRPAGPRVAILAPLSVGEAIFGLLIVSGEDLGSEDVQVFTAFAHQAAAAWRKTRLMRDLEGSLQQLRQTQDQLLHALKMEAIGRLAGGIAHDFNNMLTVISGYTSLLMDAMEGNAPALSDLGQIRNTIKRASALTSRLLAFSRKQILQPAVLDMNKVVANSVTLLRPLIGEDIELVVRLAPISLCVRADHYQMEQILMNLAVNARDAMPRGGKFILETTTAKFDEAFAEQHQSMAPGKYVLLSVSDTGSGMDGATASRIFEPFFTTKEVGKGTGLGLATVYGIVKQSAGHILVYSELGHGTTFKIYLPSADHKIGLESKPEAEAVSPKREGASILLVEDDEIMRGLTRQVLEEHGYRVFEADDGKSALEWAQSHSEPVDLLLTDVVMRRMSGPELVDRLSASRPSLKVVFMSGYTGELMAEREVLKRGITLIEKPFTRTALLNTLHATLG
jgi:signal transduction histidine kinase